MKLLRYIVLLSVLSTGGQCGSYEDEYCRGIPSSHLHYLEIENLTEQTTRIEFHQVDIAVTVDDALVPLGGEFFFNLQPGEVKTVFRGRGSSPSTGEEGSPLPESVFYSFSAYDSIVVVAEDRREVFFRIFSCNPSPSCTSSVFEGNSPGWESTWNPFSPSNWRLIEEPRDRCKRGSGDWVHRFSLRPK